MNDDCRPDQRLPKKEILRKRDAFQNILENGKRWYGQYLRFFFLVSDRRQVGFVVPRRVGKAVVRNRIKRLMREAYRKRRQQIGLYQIIIIAKNTMNNIHLKNIEKDIDQFINILGDET